MRLLHLSAFLFAVLAPFAGARDLPVANARALPKALAAARPGDRLLLAPGDWHDVRLLVRTGGTAEAPLTIAAAQPGATRFTGQSSVTIQASHVILSGLFFTDGGFPAEHPAAIVAIKALPDGSPATGDRVTDCAFVRYNPPSPEIRYPWVHLTGRAHRVDHCRFEGQDHSGVTLQVVVGAGDNHHQLDHNHFLDRPRGAAGNGYECIQLGQSQDSLRASHSVVEYNLFSACDGETETISNKSCENLYRFNTLVDCAGTLTLRHGNCCRVESNVILGHGKRGSGGIRIIGEDHVVTGNYISGVEGHGFAAISIFTGIPNSPDNGYFAAHRAVITGNVVVDARCAGIDFSGGLGDRDRSIVARDVTVRDNWILSTTPALTGTRGEGVTVENTPAAGPAPALPSATLHPLTPAEVGPSWWPRVSG